MLICALVSLPAGMLSVIHFFGVNRYVLGGGWVDDKKPNVGDWLLALAMAAVIAFPAWPAFLIYAACTSIKPAHCKELKREKKARKQALAFQQMKEARACLLRDKKARHQLMAEDWSAQFLAADAERRAAIVRRHEFDRYEYTFREEDRMRDSMYAMLDRPSYHPSYCRCFSCC